MEGLPFPQLLRVVCKTGWWEYFVTNWCDFPHTLGIAEGQRDRAACGQRKWASPSWSLPCHSLTEKKKRL